jgi:hypothetical protein
VSEHPDHAESKHDHEMSVLCDANCPVHENYDAKTEAMLNPQRLTWGGHVVGERLKIEPTAEQREGALAVRQMFIALTEDGQFTEPQALVIIGAMLGGQR